MSANFEMELTPGAFRLHLTTLARIVDRNWQRIITTLRTGVDPGRGDAPNALGEEGGP